MFETSVEKLWNIICGKGKLEKPLEKTSHTPFRPSRNPHGGTETRSLEPSGWRRLRHGAPSINKLVFKKPIGTLQAT